MRQSSNNVWSKVPGRTAALNRSTVAWSAAGSSFKATASAPIEGAFTGGKTGIIKELKIKPTPRKMVPGEDPQQNALYIISSGMMVAKTPSYTLASGLLGNARNVEAYQQYGGQWLQALTPRPATPPR